MYTIEIPGSLNHFLRESSCNTCIVQVDIIIGDKPFLGYLKLVDDQFIMDRK